MKQGILPKINDHQSVLGLRKLNPGEQGKATSKRWQRGKTSVFFKLFESQARYQLFESQYSNTQKPQGHTMRGAGGALGR